MSLNIKNKEAHHLAQELAKLTGESTTEAVTEAIRERLKRETNGRVKVRDVTIFETETTTATYFE